MSSAVVTDAVTAREVRPSPCAAMALVVFVVVVVSVVVVVVVVAAEEADAMAVWAGES